VELAAVGDDGVGFLLHMFLIEELASGFP
jgi:hypothetical protein